MKSKKHIWPKRSLWISGGFIFFILLIALAAKFWIVPRVATEKITSALEQLWDGPSAVEKVEFNYFKPSIVHQISLDDKQNRRWVEIDSVKVKIVDIPHFSPKVQEIEIDKLIINAYVTDSNIALPLKPKQAEQQPVDTLDIRKFVINEAVINIEKNEQSKITYTLNVNAEKQDGLYNIRLTQVTSQPDQMFLLTGRINPTNLKADLNIDTKQEFTSSQTDVILALLKVPDAYKTEGRLTAKLYLSGILNQPANLQPLGTVNLSNWNVLYTDQVVVTDFGTLIKYEQNRVDIENLQTNFCKGLVEGVFFVEDIKATPIIINGRVSGEKIDLAQLSNAMGREKKISKGTGSFSSNFTIAAKDINSLQGHGLVILNDTDMGAFPITPKIFEFMGLGVGQGKQSADAVTIFSITGPVITIGKARVSTPIGAVRAEPGGTVNAQTGQMDFYVVAAHLEKIEKIIKNVPAAKYIVNLKDKLARLHVEGHWSEPSEKLISKQPLTDIKDATVGFLQNVTANQGQIPQETFDEFEKLFETESKQK
ncbi:MAG: hypothetical protein MUO43_14575 [Desulfobacterales bacterium]|nr:hypothetical protein [Desulfobacterales bacterium]